MCQVYITSRWQRIYIVVGRQTIKLYLMCQVVNAREKNRVSSMELCQGWWAPDKDRDTCGREGHGLSVVLWPTGPCYILQVYFEMGSSRRMILL